MDIVEAIQAAVLTMKESFEGALNENNVEIGVVGENRLFRTLSPDEVKDYLE